MMRSATLSLMLLAGCAVPLGSGLELTAFSLSDSGNADVTSGPDSIDCTMTITSTLNPVAAAGCVYRAPNGKEKSCVTSTAEPAPANTYKCTLDFLPQDPNGNWTLRFVYVLDTGGNKVQATGTQVETDLEVDATIQVLSLSEDVTPPEIESFVVVPTIIESGVGDDVTGTVTASDLGSGVESIGYTFFSPTRAEVLTCIETQGSNCTATMPADAELGVWTLDSAFARDNRGNITSIRYGNTLSVQNFGVGGAGGQGGAGGAANIVATVETDPVPSAGDAADDPAIWVHPTTPGQSLILGTDKSSGLGVYDMSGTEIQFLSLGDINNVDVRYGFPLDGASVDIVAAGNRTSDTIEVYKVDPTTRVLSDIAAGSLTVGITMYGSCLYRSPTTGKFYFFANSKSGEVEQWELFDNGAGAVTASLERSFDVGTQVEGCVADDQLANFFIGEEDVGIWRYGAEPDDTEVRYSVDTTSGNLAADIEGLALYYGAGTTGYLIASSQGDSTFAVYERGGNQAYQRSFSIVSNGIDAVTGTDGIDVTSAPLGAGFPSGAFVAQDNGNDVGNQNYKLVPWETIANYETPLFLIDTTVNPRTIGRDTWPDGPADTCSTGLITSACICEGVEYDEGYCHTTGYSFSDVETEVLYVIPGGTGDLSGADWANALPNLDTLVRDTFYWIADGAYNAGAKTTFNTAASGNLGITIRKATEASHGTNTGWQSTYGDGQAVFDWIAFNTDRWTFDGGELNGILVRTTVLLDEPPYNDDEDTIYADGSFIVIRNVEGDGGVTTSAASPANECTNDNGDQALCQRTGSCSVAHVTNDRYVFDRVNFYNAADDGIEAITVTNFKIANSKIYSMRSCGSDGSFCGGPCFNGHSDGLELRSPSTNVHIWNTMIYDIPNTGCLFIQDPTDPRTNSNNVTVRNSVFYCPQVGLAAYMDHVDNFEMTNTIVWGREQGSTYGGFNIGSSTSGVVLRNNVMTTLRFSSSYNPSLHDLDYNHFGVDPAGYTLGANDSAGDPLFVNVPLSGDINDHTPADLLLDDFASQPASPLIDTGTAAGFAWDIYGNARPTGPAYDMGCFDVDGGGGTGGAPPAGPCDNLTPDLSATSGWNNSGAQALATTTLTYTTYFRTSALDSIATVSAQPVTDFSQAPVLVRCNSAGQWDMRHGGVYAADNAIACNTGVWYKLTVVADYAAGTYTASVGTCDDTPTQIRNTASDFRTGAPIGDGLDYYGAWSGTGTADLDQASWVPGACTPTTCGAIPATCGTPPDGCGGTLASCGSCTNPDVCCTDGGAGCTQWACCTPSTTVCTDPDPDYECGDWADGCGGTVNCGSCTVGETCVAGTCVPDSGKPSSLTTACAGSPYPTQDCDDLPSTPDTNCSDISESYVTANCPGRVCSNFWCKGGILDIDTSNVTLRNFKLDSDGSIYGIRINDGISNTVIEYGELINADSANIFDKGQNTIVRYNWMHHNESDMIKADGDGGLFEHNLYEQGGAGEGSHADGVQCVSGTNNEFRFNNCSMPKPGTPTHEAYPASTNPPYIYPGPPWRSNACFIVHSGCLNLWAHDNWMNGGNYTVYGNSSTLIENNIFGRENADHPDNNPDCTLCTGRARLCNGPFQDWRGNVYEDNGLSAGEGEEDGGDPCD